MLESKHCNLVVATTALTLFCGRIWHSHPHTSVSLGHRPSPRLGTENTLIALPAKLGVEERVELVSLNLL